MLMISSIFVQPSVKALGPREGLLTAGEQGNSSTGSWEAVAVRVSCRLKTVDFLLWEGLFMFSCLSSPSIQYPHSTPTLFQAAGSLYQECFSNIIGCH